MNELLVRFLGLTLFGEGGADGGTGEAAGAAETGTEAPKVPTFTPRRGSKANPLADVKYGKQGSSADAVETAPGEDRQAKFDALIKGEYKDLYDQRVKDTISKRFKGSAEQTEQLTKLQAQLDKQSAAMKLMANRYGVTADETGNFDIDALSKAIEDDDSLWEDEALKEGLSVEQLKSIRKMEAENESLRNAMNENRAREQADQLVAEWQNQAEDAKRYFPEFELEKEVKNPQFVDLLRRGIDVRAAYQVIHFDDLVSGAMRTAAHNVESKITNKIASNGSRPTENGNTAQGAAVVKSDVALLSKADRQEIIRRVARGEKITF